MVMYKNLMRGVTRVYTIDSRLGTPGYNYLRTPGFNVGKHIEIKRIEIRRNDRLSAAQ